MRVRVGTVIAFGAGYVLGTQAGRQRYLQIVQVARQVGRSAPVAGTTGLVADKTRAVATLGIERFKDTVGVRLGWRDGDDAADGIAIELSEELATALSGRRH
jgi:hypothetical protein